MSVRAEEGLHVCAWGVQLCVTVPCRRRVVQAPCSKYGEVEGSELNHRWA
jgi:hypothetical protein